MEDNNVTLFEQQHLAAFKQLSELKKEQDKLAQIEKAMDENNIVSIKNDYITISRIAASQTTSIDLKKLEEKEPQLYADLLKDYPKLTNKKASIRFLVK